VSHSEIANESPTSFKGPRQIHIAKRRELIIFPAGDWIGGEKAKFYVTNPDSRCRLRVSIMAKFAWFSAGATLWLAGAEFDQGGPSGTLEPHTNLEGTQAVPVPIPATAGLLGYSREFETSADAIYGEITLPESGSGPGATVYVTARIQPSGQRLPWPEWEEVRSELQIRILRRLEPPIFIG